MDAGIRTAGLGMTFPGRRGLHRGAPKVAVDGLDLAIPPGRVTGLLGLNGAGKTTTIKIMATLLRPTSGTIHVDGIDVVAKPREVRRRINLIAGGERMVYMRMTGRENLWYFGQLYDVPRTVLRKRIDELLELVGLTKDGDTAVEKYSRGMTQRLSIARGLINDPAYLLLDEPTLGLDAPIARDLRKVVARLAAEGRGVLLTSHYLDEVEELCDHVYLISDGKHLAQGSPEELMAAAGCDRSVRVVITNPSAPIRAIATEFAATLGVTPTIVAGENGELEITIRHAEDVAGPLMSALVTGGAAISQLEALQPNLEDAVLTLAAGGAVPAEAEAVRA